MENATLISTVALAAIAVATIATAYFLSKIALALEAMSRNSNAIIDKHDPDPHHHFRCAEKIVIWEWRNKQWNLQSRGLTPMQAGAPPNRAGGYEGECITTRRK